MTHKELPYEALRIPPFQPGMTIGLYGGSFNPPHAAHEHVAATALTRLGLDRVWWLVTPGNPLKSHDELASLADRMAAVESLADHPRFVITALEAGHGLTFSADTVSFLVRRCPGVHFVWIMGADNLASFHRWERWRDIAELVPIVIVDRPGSSLAPLSAPMAQIYASARVDESEVRAFGLRQAPAWTFLHAPRSHLSSTMIRQQRKDSGSGIAGLS